MATEPKTPQPQVSDAGANAIAEAIAAGVQAALAANAPKRKVTYGEVAAKNAPPKLMAPAYQNSKEVNPRGLSDATIQKLFEIPTGSYLNGLVRVHRRPDLGIEFYYDNYSSPDRRVAFMLAVRSFSDMVAKLHDEAQSRAASKT